MAERSGVCCAAKASPAVQAGMLLQSTEAVVSSPGSILRERSKEAFWKLPGSFPSSPQKVISVASESDSSAVNWMYALVMVAPCGIVRLSNRIPTIWALAGDPPV